MPMRDRLARLVQRNPERPTLRQRAAALKASAAKVMRRKPAPADATPAVAEPVSPQLSDTLSNPDAALLRLGHALEAAIAAEREACARADAAIHASGASERADPRAEEEAEEAGTSAANLARQVAEMPAYTADGLRLKIRALIYYDPHSFKAPPEAPDPHHILAHSLSLDAGRAGAPVAADPIFPALEEARRLGLARERLFAACGALPDAAPEWEPEREAYTAWFDHIDNVLMQTVPTTAAGCVALARFVVDFCAEQGIPITQGTDAASVDNIGPLRLIAQSPALTGIAAYADPVEDPVFAAIEAHAAAREAYSATVNASDRAWVAQHGGDTSDAAMVAAEAVRDAASDAEDEAWEALLGVRPATAAGVLSLTQHVARWAPETEGLVKGNALEPVFASIAAGLSAVLADGAQREDVDWFDAPSGFMAFPVFEPVGFRRILDALPEEVARLHRAALAEFTRRMACIDSDVSQGERQAFAAQLRADLFLGPLTAAVDRESDGAKALAALDVPALAAGEPDPIFAALDAIRAPEAENDAFHAIHSVGRVGPGYTAEEEQRLFNVMSDAWDVVFSTTPTTRAGQIALLEFIDSRIRQSTADDGSVEGSDTVFADGFRALARAIRAGITDPHAVPPGPSADAELIALGRQFDAAHAAWMALVPASDAAHDRVEAFRQRAVNKGMEEDAALKAAWLQDGVNSAHEAEETAFAALEPLNEAIMALQAHTVEGLAVKARAAIVTLWPAGDFEGDRARGKDENWEKRGPRDLIDACTTLARRQAVGGLPADGRIEKAGAVAAGGMVLHEDAESASDRFANDALRLFDFGAMTPFEVMTLHNHARAIRHVAHGLLAMPCSRRGASDRVLFNAAGALPGLIADLAGNVMDNCITEARGAREDLDAEAERLSVLAEQVIFDGDVEPIRTLARDLVALADRG